MNTGDRVRVERTPPLLRVRDKLSPCGLFSPGRGCGASQPAMGSRWRSGNFVVVSVALVGLHPDGGEPTGYPITRNGFGYAVPEPMLQRPVRLWRVYKSNTSPTRANQTDRQTDRGP